LYDILIKNGKIVDGTGNPWFRADVAVKNGRISKVGRLVYAKAKDVIDAGGLVVSPGFIDMHSHSDFAIPFDPKASSALHQGVTTMVVGNCGMSLAPVSRDRKDLLMEYLSPFLPHSEILKVQWSSFSDYLRYQGKIECSLNIVNLVGHGTIRIAVMGFEERDPTKKEIENMSVLVAEAMEAGAFGMSSGLIYSPGIYSKTNELIELSKVVSKYGGIYTSHIRGESANLIESVKEAIEIGEKSDTPVEISHHKAAGRPQWGKSKETLKLMEDARSRGVDVTCDQYPYEAGMTSLIMLLPPWVHEGGMDKIIERLEKPDQRERIRRDIQEGIPGWDNLLENCGWENIFLSYVGSEKNKFLEGKNLIQITKLAGKPDELTALFDLILEEKGRASMVVFEMNEDDILRIMQHPLTMIGTDSWAVSTEGVLNIGKPHPRFYGTYPKILGGYVREKGVLSLEKAVNKMTSFPAQKVGLLDRGIIREGMWADIVVFNENEIKDKATYGDPHQYAEGIEYVLVNGKMTIVHGKYQNIAAGKVLLHKPLESQNSSFLNYKDRVSILLGLPR